MTEKYDYHQKKFFSLLIDANQSLAKLDGLTLVLPNYEVLIHPLLAKESIASNKIENINTTMIEFLQQEAIGINRLSWAEKEVQSYRNAVMYGVEQVEKYGWISVNLLIELQAIIEPNKIGIRKIPWTVIANSNAQVLYTPPQGEDVIRKLLYDLESYIQRQDDIDPLIKVSVIHHQFESIHPFYDGNGRIWRILMLLYLILCKKISKPVLFLSSFILSEKQQYYQSFRRNNEEKRFDDIIPYILRGITLQAKATQEKIISIHHLMEETSTLLKTQWFKEYYHITKMLFSFPFMTVQTFAEKMSVSRQAISETIKKLENTWIIKSMKLKNSKLLYVPSFIEVLK